MNMDMRGEGELELLTLEFVLCAFTVAVRGCAYLLTANVNVNCCSCSLFVFVFATRYTLIYPPLLIRHVKMPMSVPVYVHKLQVKTATV
jgi:hypothetical protein